MAVNVKKATGRRKSVRATTPLNKRPPFECIALLLQGGGALGSYQAGVYQALTEADLHPDWVAGISIGAINAALIAGNPPERRIEQLRAFWEGVSTPPFGVPYIEEFRFHDEYTRRAVNQARVLGTLIGGAPHFFSPRVPPPMFQPSGTIEALSYYDIAPLKATLEALVDFDRINGGVMRFSVGAVNIRSGNFTYFDTTTHRIRAEHIMASGSLPPGFPPTEIDGEHYWDGGIVSNTPLDWVLDHQPQHDTLAFQVDLWNARGELPRDLNEAAVRLKDIQYSSRTRASTDQFRRKQALRRAAATVLPHLPASVRRRPEARMLEAAACHKVFNIVHLIYRAQTFEGSTKDTEFSRRTMEEHWKAGYDDAINTLRHPEVRQRPDTPDGVRTFDLGNDGTVNLQDSAVSKTHSRK
ncbi:MAG: patatin-like phospholipase family protein [Burkholderiaceae bacterium]